MWQSVYDRVEATLNHSRGRRSNQSEPLSPNPMRAEVQKPSNETRRLQQLFRFNADEVKESPDLSSAAKIILGSLSPSHPWHNITDIELIEKFENHAESLLSDSSFVEAFKEWPGLEEIKSVCIDKKWWRKRRITQNRTDPSRLRPRNSQGDLLESSEPTVSGSLDSASVDDDMGIETPAQAYPKTAKKGTSILRPRFSMSHTHTPGTPTREMDSQSMTSGGLLESDKDLTDDELQLLQLPADVSQRIKNEKIPSRKRKSDETIQNNSKRVRGSRMEVPKNPPSIQFGRGRPPLSTVLVTPVFLCNFLMVDPVVVK